MGENSAVSAGDLEPLEQCESNLKDLLKFPSTYKRLGHEKTSENCEIFPDHADRWEINTIAENLSQSPHPTKNILIPLLKIYGKCSDYSKMSPKKKYISYILKVEYSAKVESNQTRLGLFECIVSYKVNKGMLGSIFGNNLSFSTIYYRFKY